MPPTAAPRLIDIHPLAPSVEKAYYRKCIELKRRLNEVETANDEAKIRRTRLDRGIMKMRLERAFLLDELRKRMEYNVDGSEGSGDEGTTTPPPDRPHRDKRRRTDPVQPPPPATQPSPYPLPPSQQVLPSQPGNGVHTVAPSANQTHNDSDELGGRRTSNQQRNRPSHGSPPGPTPVLPSVGIRALDRDDPDGGEERGHSVPINRGSGATGEPLGAGIEIRDATNRQGRVFIA